MEFKKWVMGIGIAVVFAIFMGFVGWEVSNDSRERCVENEDWVCCGTSKLVPTDLSYYEYQTDECDESFSEADDSYCDDNSYKYSFECDDAERNMMGIVAVIFGVIGLGIGLYIRSNEVISGGLIGGGIISLITALIVFWSDLSSIMRIVISGVTLVGLVTVAWYKMRD